MKYMDLTKVRSLTAQLNAFNHPDFLEGFRVLENFLAGNVAFVLGDKTICVTDTLKLESILDKILWTWQYLGVEDCRKDTYNAVFSEVKKALNKPKPSLYKTFPDLRVKSYEDVKPKRRIKNGSKTNLKNGNKAGWGTNSLY